jgi:Glycosyl hydrolases family 25
MPIYGIDISNYQAGMTDFGAVRRDGYDFAFVLSTDGTGFRNTHFARQLDGCRAAGLLTAAYHYVRDTSVAEQIRNVTSQVPRGCPVIPDCEDNSGGVGVLRAIVGALRNEGYPVPMIYLPQWYWSGHLGRPDLGGLPPLWVSWYPDHTTRPKEVGAGLLPSSVWNGYGGLGVAVAQFTSSGRVPGYGSAVDQNVFRGTRAQLEALLGDRRPGSRRRAADMATIITNLETGQTALLDGGVLTGISGHNARHARDTHGVGEVGVTPAEWDDMVKKSANIERVNENVARTHQLLEELIGEVRRLNEAAYDRNGSRPRASTPEDVPTPRASRPGPTG